MSSAAAEVVLEVYRQEKNVVVHEYSMIYTDWNNVQYRFLVSHQNVCVAFATNKEKSCTYVYCPLSRETFPFYFFGDAGELDAWKNSSQKAALVYLSHDKILAWFVARHVPSPIANIVLDFATFFAAFPLAKLSFPAPIEAQRIVSPSSLVVQVKYGVLPEWYAVDVYSRQKHRLVADARWWKDLQQKYFWNQVLQLPSGRLIFSHMWNTPHSRPHLWLTKKPMSKDKLFELLLHGLVKRCTKILLEDPIVFPAGARLHLVDGHKVAICLADNRGWMHHVVGIIELADLLQFEAAPDKIVPIQKTTTQELSNLKIPGDDLFLRWSDPSQNCLNARNMCQEHAVNDLFPICPHLCVGLNSSTMTFYVN